MMETSFLSETTVLQTENNVHYYTMTKHVHKIEDKFLKQVFLFEHLARFVFTLQRQSQFEFSFQVASSVKPPSQD